MPESRQSFLRGALVLAAATALVKLLGALFKIPLTQILGGGGMGYFMTAYGFFNPIYAMSIAGFPVAVSRMVSQSTARQSYREARRILKVALLLFASLGAFLSMVIFFGAGTFADWVGNPTARIAVCAIAPAVFFGCVNAAFRGYNEGLRNMVPTALSQVVEAVARLAGGILLSLWMLTACRREYEALGTVFGRAAASSEQALSYALPYAAAAAVLGVALSTAAGTLFLFIRQGMCGDRLSDEQLARSPAPRSAVKLGISLLALALPVCMGALAVNLTSLIDLASIMKRLAAAVARDPALLSASHHGALPSSLSAAEIPNFLYGSYTGMAGTLFNLVPAMTASFATSALPVVSSLWTQKRLAQLERSVESILRMTALFVLPAGLGLSVMSGPILQLLFGADRPETAIAAPLLSVMGIAAIFVGITIPVNSMLQGMGLAYLPVKLMAVGGAIKIAVNYMLVAMPGINIKGAPFGTLACYLFIVAASLTALFSQRGNSS